MDALFQESLSVRGQSTTLVKDGQRSTKEAEEMEETQDQTRRGARSDKFQI
jgi:hypothetical protein